MSSNKFENLVDMFERSVKAYGPRELFGTKKNGQWVWTTYAEMGKLVDDFRGGLASLGIKRGDNVCIVSNNRVEWAVAAYACYGLGAAFVPMYEAQAADEWLFILKDCTARVVIGSKRTIYETLVGRKSEVPTLEHVLGIELPADDSHAFANVSARGRLKPVPSIQPAPGEIAGFIYTSGTTGLPKGVAVRHRNVATVPNHEPQWTGAGWIHGAPMFTFAGIAFIYNPMKMGLVGLYLPRFDAGRWLEWFLEDWPPGTPGHEAYRNRIAHGSGLALEQAARGGFRLSSAH